MLRQYGFVIISLWHRIYLCLALFLLVFTNLSAQNFYFDGNRKKQTINFKFVKNLIIIPVYINGKGPFNFILDTGVGAMIITNHSIIDSLVFDKMRKIKITGLGLQEVDAFITNGLNAQVGLAKIKNIPATILKEDLFNLSGYLGLNVDGLIGYSFFNSFVVDIRYSANRLKFYLPNNEPDFKEVKNPIYIQNLKPYIDITLELPNGEEVLSRLLIDTGASHAISLESFDHKPFPLPMPNIQSNLGMSLSGEIKGNVARVKKIKLGNYQFKDVISGFPDYKYVESKLESNRNGNLGADLLHRFNIVINYHQKYLILKPNIYFKKSFEYDMVGATVFMEKDLQRFFISEVDQSSPAEQAGLRSGDEIIALNFKNISSFSLSDLNELFRSGQDKKILFEVLRAGTIQVILVRLQKRI